MALTPNWPLRYIQSSMLSVSNRCWLYRLICNWSHYLRRRRRLYFWCGLFVCLSVGLLVCCTTCCTACLLYNKSTRNRSSGVWAIPCVSCTSAVGRRYQMCPKHQSTRFCSLYCTLQPSVCHGKIIQVQSLGQCSRGKYPNFWRYPNFPKMQHRKTCMQSQLDPCSRFDTIPACVRHIHRHRTTASMYTSIASRGWKCMLEPF